MNQGIENALKDLKVNGNFLSSVLTAFDLMDIAERVIAKGELKYPDRATQIHDTFRLMLPSKMMNDGYTDMLYELHCQEIIERTARGEDTRPATKAEILSSLAEISLVTPLTRSATGFYLKLFNELFPNFNWKEESQFADHTKLEEWDGQYDEMLETYQNKLAQDWRQ